MQKRTTQVWGAAAAILLALVIAAILASIARAPKSLGASLAASSTPVYHSAEVTVVMIAQRDATPQPERRARNRRNAARGLATSEIPLIPSISDQDEQLIVSDADPNAQDPEVLAEQAQGIGGPDLSAYGVTGQQPQPAPVTLIPIATRTAVGAPAGATTAAPATPVTPSRNPPSGSGPQPTATPVGVPAGAATATASAIAPKPEPSRTPAPTPVVRPTASPLPGGSTPPPATSAPTKPAPAITIIPATASATLAPTFGPPPLPPTARPTASQVPPTAIPNTAVPPTSIPTAIPTAVPTQVPTEPPTAIPPTATDIPPTATATPPPSPTVPAETSIAAHVYSSLDYAPRVGWQVTVYRQGTQDMLAASGTDDSGYARMTLLPVGVRVCVSFPAGWRAVHPSDGCYYQSLPPGNLALDFVVEPAN